MNKLNIDHLITLYRRSDTSRLPEVSTNAITAAVRRSSIKSLKNFLHWDHPFRLISVAAGVLCGLFLLTFFIISHPVHRNMIIAIDISRDAVSLPSTKPERSVKKETLERFVYISRDGRDVSVKL